MPRTRIRSDQAQDISFVSETELNQFLDAVVITGTEDATAVVQLFDDYFPGRGLIVGVDGNVVVTGTQLVTVSGFRDEFVSASGTLQTQIDDIVVGSGTVPDHVGAGTVTVITGTNLLTFSGSPHTVISGTGGITATTDGNIVTVSGFHEDIDSLVHNLSEDTFADLTRNAQGRVTNVDTYTSEGPVSGTLIRSVEITRNAQNRVSQVVENQHDASGTIIQILTTTINRGPDNRTTSVETDEEQLVDFF